MSKKKKEPKKSARVHKDLQGFEIKVNEHGEITSNYSIDQINEFLNKNVEDKKLTKRKGSAKDEDEEFPIEEVKEEEETEEEFLARTRKTSDEDEEDDSKLKDEDED